MNNKKLYAWMLLGAATGLAASFWQLMEKITLLKNSDAALSCNLSSVFNCSSVLTSDQASIFGPPNALIGVIMFTFFLTVALLAVTGSSIAKRLVYVIEALALFMLGFTLWFLYQSIFNIQSVCIFCIFVGTGVLIINAGMLRQTLSIIKFKPSTQRRINKFLNSGADIFMWALLWIVVGFVMALKFL